MSPSDPHPPHDDPRTDEQLVRQINAGDPDAFEALYRRYRNWAVRLGVRLTGDRDIALDAMQETFLYLLRKFPGFTLTAKMTTFLYPVVRHNVLRAKDRKRRLVAHVDDPPQPMAPAGDDPANHPGDALGDVLADLSAEHREVVMMRFVDGFSLREIAEALTIPLGTVKSRLHHALTTLRNDPRIKEYFLD